MRKLSLFAVCSLLLLGASLGQYVGAQTAEPMDSAGQVAPAPGTTGANPTLTIEGKLDLHLIGKPTLTTADGVVYKLVGEQASTIQRLKRIDDKTIVVAGQVLKESDSSTLNLSVLSFWVVGTAGAVGTMPAKSTGPGAKVTPVVTLRGTLGTKFIGTPDLTTVDGKVYKLIGPQVTTIEELEDLNKGRLEVNGQLVDNNGRLEVVVLSFRLLDAAGGPDDRGAIGTAMESGSGTTSDMEPSINVRGVLSTRLMGQPDLTTKDGRVYRLIGPQVPIIGATGDIDGKTITATGQVMTNGELENLVVSSFQIQEAPSSEPARHPASLLNPATGAPPVAAPADPQKAPRATPRY